MWEKINAYDYELNQFCTEIVITDGEIRSCTEGKIAASNCLLNQLLVQLTVAIILVLDQKNQKGREKNVPFHLQRHEVGVYFAWPFYQNS